jgi:DnaJ-class molecular chaperone
METNITRHNASGKSKEQFESETCRQCNGKGWYMTGEIDNPQQQPCEACDCTGHVEYTKPQPNDQAEARGTATSANQKPL